MKIFERYSIIKKIIAIVTIIMSLSFVKPKPVEAWGGTLMNPICDLVMGIGDGFVNVLHYFLIGQEQTIIKVDKGGNWRIVVAILAAIGRCYSSGCTCSFGLYRNWSNN